MIHTEQFPTELSTGFRPLMPGSGLGERADTQLRLLEAHGFVAATGAYESQLGRLAAMAHEPAITEYCPNDPRRFGTLEAVEKWLKKGRVMVGVFDTGKPSVTVDYNTEWLFDVSSLQQVAYGWFGPETNEYIKGADITTAYRVGSTFRPVLRERSNGTDHAVRPGLALGTLVVAVARKTYGLRPYEISLETWRSNAAANRLYEELGFEEVSLASPIPQDRPTHHVAGSSINGSKVYFDQESGRNKVDDFRLFKRLVQTAIY